MLLTIKNEYLNVTVDTLGAQLMSIKGKHGIEYLWQGDPAYWAKRAPVLFPVIGRLEGQQYALNGNIYDMPIHGFAAKAEFAVEAHTADCLTLSLSDNPDTQMAYPCAFHLEITYRLVGATLRMENRVTNCDSNVLHFAFGGHPGFRVPWDEGSFEDYYLEFGEACTPERVGFTTDTVLVNGHTEPYSLENGRILPLRHDLFDEDAVILQHMARQVTLKAPTGGSITVSYPDMPYLGIWHRPQMAAPYVCIEPWTSLPGRSNIMENIACRSDYIHLPADCAWDVIWAITVQENEA